MPKARIPSPARSQSALVTPRRAMPSGPRSVGSPARSNTSVRLTSVIQNFKDKNMDSFHLSPLNSRRSVLNDNTDIEEPKRKSWWKKLNDTSRDIMEVLENDKPEEPYNVLEEYMDVEVLSQEKKNPTLDLPDSSDNESISSIVVPQRKLFSQKENQPHPQKKFAEFLGTRESMAKLNKTSGASDKSEKTIIAGTKKLFGQNSKPRSKPAFPTELLRFSPDKTINKTAGEVKGQVRNLFGNRAGVKRKNNFADFIASESEEEPEIQPKVFGFQKKNDVPSRRVSNASRGNRDHSPTSSVTTDIDMEDWKMLPSSTMVQTQLEAMMTDSPAKKARLSKLSEGKESEAATNSTAITNKTKQSNKSVISKNKSKMSVSKTSINKSKTSPKRNDNEIITKTAVNEEGIPEQVDPELDNDENEVSLHYSDDDLQEENLEKKDENAATNNTKQSNKPAASKNKSNMSASKESLDKSKISVNAQKSIAREADVEAVNANEKNYNKSKTKNDSKLDKADEMQEEESPEAAEIQEIEDENQASDVEQEDDEQENENQESDKQSQNSEVEDEEQKNESQEIEDENYESEVDKEDGNESNEIEAENRDSEIEHKNAEQESVSQEIEDHKNESEEVKQEDKEQFNQSQELDTEAPADADEQNESQEIEKISVNKEATVNVTANKTKLSNQSVNSINESKKSLLINKSKTSPKANISHNVLNNGEVESDNAGNDIFSHGDEGAKEIDNIGSHDNDTTNKAKHFNESVTSNNKSKMSVSKNLINKTNNSPNKSGTSVNKPKMSTSKISLINKSKISLHTDKNLHDNIADEDQIDAENAVVNNSLEIHKEKVVDESVENESELEKEQEESLEVKNESKEAEEQNQLSELDEEEPEIEDIDQGNESQELVNDSEAVESESEHENEEEDNEEDEENNEDEDEQVKSEEMEVENEEDRSQEIENESQEVDNDDNKDEENEEAEESEIEVENVTQEEMVEDMDDLQESNEVKEESDEQNDVDIDNQASEEEISGTEEGTPNATHDTTGRNRKKNNTNVKSPEAILHDNTNQNESFTAKGRNTSIRLTSLKSLNITPSLDHPRESTGFSDGTKNSSTEGSGWDSHRITKKTLRQTFGRDFTPRKSLRALVMEKSAKRHTEFNVNDVDMPRANSTELPEDTRFEIEVDPHDVSKRTRQTTLEMYLQKIKKQNMEKRMKLEEEVRNSLNAPSKEFANPFNVPSRPFALKRAKPAQTKPKAKAVKTMIPLDDLPQELIEDMKYKPPKRFQPSNASWITKRLYKFLESKLEAKYDYKARIRAEKLVETIYSFTKELRRHNAAPPAAVDALKHEMARLDIVRTHFDFYQFFHNYMPREVRVKVNPDVVNNIPLPRQGVFTDILRGNTVQG